MKLKKLKKNLLVAVDDSVHSRNALRYLARISEWVHDLGFTLFSVQPAVSQFLQEEARRDPAARRELDRIATAHRRAAQDMMEGHREFLVRSGVDEERIRTVTRLRVQGVARDILTYTQEGLFDAVVMGRRGRSRFQDLLMGSVTAGVVENARFAPVWLVDGDVTDRRILAAVDGSENSLRAVDHLAFILGGLSGAEVLLFHMTPRLKDTCGLDLEKEGSPELETAVARENRRCIDNFRQRAGALLEQAGIPESRVQWKSVEGWSDVAGAILDEAAKGGYGTVVLGRRGQGNRFFSGTISRRVTARLSGTALWLVP
jgi:nucleotide-binding universal stress UspA family protein